MKVCAVDGSHETTATLLRWLQLEILPTDKPQDTSCGHWWIVYDAGLPVGFAGVMQSIRWCDTGYLCRAGVVKSHRGKGLQKRLIRVRERKARDIGWNWLITDTASYNVASSNNLAACGFKLFRPTRPWSHDDGLYWRKEL